MIEQENFTIIEPPVLVGFEILTVEADNATGALRRISRFRWRDRDHWLLGRMVWHNRLAVGYALLMPTGGRRPILQTPVTVHPNYSPPEFVIHKPNVRRYPKDGTFVFIGFDHHTVIDIKFARLDDRRLRDREYTRPGEELKIPKPPKGSIV
jgi:hypothetical protein